jgi:predicted nucleic acid-binding protein
MIAIDTNVFFYAVDADQPERRVKAIALLTSYEIAPDVVVPWQVVCEFLSLLRKRQSQKRITAEELESCLRKMLNSFQLVFPTRAVLDRALELFSRYSLSHWDSLLVAACLEAGVSTLYSEDMGHETQYDGLTIINPFL